ncbi:alpha/beta hydrolase [Actinoplanes sp. KI2]|uniref:alpha/beta hydrolase n=1 Tax=Actinoplanes sp. KI2 TaxID=2983315 RepID=UPI0021D5C610|nr:alpha/beta hydrolase [Actinoplanes sp. KI2]MCU7724681.1 alpha/beta hydrolase [Actinoplanes sp. KI2]
MTRPLRAAVVLLLTLFPYAGSPAQARATRAPAISWRQCPENVQVQCGTLRVPADWADPYGPTVLLTVARRPATDPAQRIGALLVNPGGPGTSAVDFTLDAPTFFSENLRRHFDIVGLDPRGIGRSTPVLCSPDVIDARPNPLIESESAYLATIAYNRRLAADCAARTGPVFQHVDNLSVVRDLDALRAALGEEKISFYGASYGSLLGEQYAERYPRRLRALVLDGVMDHTADIGRFLTEETDAAQDSFREFVSWCARDTQCVLHGQDVPARWAELIARARAGTLEDPYDPPTKVDEADLIQSAFAAFYDPQWYSFAYYVRDAAGDRAVPALPKGAETTPPANDAVEHSFPAVICGDWQLPVTGYADLHRRLSTLAARAPQMVASPLALAVVVDCLGWPVPPPNPQGPLIPPPGLPPVLLVGSRHDPVTAYAWAQRVAQQFGPVGSLLTYEGWGHVVYKDSPCVSAAVDAYLIGLTRPQPGASCPAVAPQPFGVG